MNFSAPDGPITNTATVSSPTSDPNPGNNTASATTTVSDVLSNISGIVYVDPNNTGVYVSSDKVLAGVTVYLTGTDRLGNSVSLSTVTNAAGQYTFNNLVSGNYNVSNSPVAGYTAGKITAGTGVSADAVDGAFSDMGRFRVPPRRTSTSPKTRRQFRSPNACSWHSIKCARGKHRLADVSCGHAIRLPAVRHFALRSGVACESKAPCWPASSMLVSHVGAGDSQPSTINCQRVFSG